jgi:hypothetical protein
MNITAETMALMKAALRNNSPDLAKAVTTSQGLTFYDLQAPAKNLYPVITKLRNMTPRVSRPAGYGTACNWKVVQAITGSGYDAMGWIPEGQRSGAMTYTTENMSAPYITLGEEDYLTFEAESAGEGFEDLNATVSMRLLQKTMRKEETGLLAGNSSLALGTPSTPVLSAPTNTTSTLPSGTYSVIVVALTAEGWLNCKGSAASGFTTSKTITGMDGNTYTLSGGNSNKSANATQAVTINSTMLAATVTPIVGAVAYAWFVGTTGSETLQAITTINSATFSAPLATGRQAATTVTSDNSSNGALAFNGYLINGFQSGTVTIQPTGTAGTGTPLTASGRGSIVEIDSMLKGMWDSYRLGPTVIFVSSQEQQNITNKVLSNASGPLLRYDVSATPGQPYALSAGGQIRYYYNPYTGGGMESGPGGGDTIPVVAHPDLPAGTIFAHCEKLPEWYQSNEVPNVAEVITRRDYYRVDWPLRTRRREYGVYAEEVLAVYAPFALGIITNIANG